MKPSEAMLRIIQEQGGEVESTQFTVWLGKLKKAEFLETDHRDRGQGILYYKLTNKAKALLEKKGV